MDKKVKKYEKAIQTFLVDYSSIKPANWRSAHHQVIIDPTSRNYQLVRFGWMDGKHVHFAVFHFHIANGKVWVLQNRTDIDIIGELEYLGVPERDIEIACFSPVELPLEVQAA